MNVKRLVYEMVDHRERGNEVETTYSNETSFGTIYIHTNDIHGDMVTTYWFDWESDGFWKPGQRYDAKSILDAEDKIHKEWCELIGPYVIEQSAVTDRIKVLEEELDHLLVDITLVRRVEKRIKDRIRDMEKSIAFRISTYVASSAGLIKEYDPAYRMMCEGVHQDSALKIELQKLLAINEEIL